MQPSTGFDWEHVVTPVRLIAWGLGLADISFLGFWAVIYLHDYGVSGPGGPWPLVAYTLIVMGVVAALWKGIGEVLGGVGIVAGALGYAYVGTFSGVVLTVAVPIMLIGVLFIACGWYALAPERPHPPQATSRTNTIVLPLAVAIVEQPPAPQTTGRSGPPASLLDWLLPGRRKATQATQAAEAAQAAQKAAVETRSAAEIALNKAARAKDAAEAAIRAANEAWGKVDSAKTEAEDAEREAEDAIEAAMRWDVAESVANTDRDMREQLTGTTSRAVGRSTIDELVKEEGRQITLATKARHDARHHANAAEYAARLAIRSANDAETYAGDAETYAGNATKYANTAEDSAKEARTLAKAAGERPDAAGTTHLSQMAQLADEAEQAALRAQEAEQAALRAQREAARARQDVDQMKLRAAAIEQKAAEAVNEACAGEAVQEAEGAFYAAKEAESEAYTAEADLQHVERASAAAETDAGMAKTEAAQVVQQADSQAGTP